MLAFRGFLLIFVPHLRIIAVIRLKQSFSQHLFSKNLYLNVSTKNGDENMLLFDAHNGLTELICLLGDKLRI